MTSIFTAIFLGETMRWRLMAGVALMTAGALITLEWQ
jgi:drug/metabolite transporter (DMT)-like permease